MPMTILRLGVAAAALAWVFSASVASAYPEFQFSTGNTRCNMCHFAPDGGGLINQYGRFASASAISRGGNGRFMHGLVDEPKWLRTGADFRVAATMRDHATESELALFPMQGDVYTNLIAGDFSASITLGVRAQVRAADSPLGRIVSREHYLMWRPKTTGPYARAGRYFPTYGLRSVDHTSYSRRFLGFHSLEEKYAVGGGVVENDWEVHANAYVPAPVFPLDFSSPAVVGRAASGGAVYYERRLGRQGAVGAQTKIDFTRDDARYLAGLTGKYYFDGPSLLLLSQLDLGHQSFDLDRSGGAAPGRNQLAAHLGLTYFPIQGLMVGAAIERYDADLSAPVARDALRLSAQFFPRAHWEIMALTKLESQGGNYGERAALGMLMLHYYL
jgi:hypothetical protein